MKRPKPRTKKKFKKRPKRRAKAILLTVITTFIGYLIINQTFVRTTVLNYWNKYSYTNLNERMFSHLKIDSERRSVFDGAIALNGNSSSNACVFFMAEALRREGVQVPKNTMKTSELISILDGKGFVKVNDYRELQPGDIVFTTDDSGNKDGIPSHTYVFMEWLKTGSYDYAYICDNQAKDYNNQIYHIRNIKERDNVRGVTKDAFSFFMRYE